MVVAVGSEYEAFGGDRCIPVPEPHRLSLLGLLTNAYLKAYDNLRIFEKLEVKELKWELAKPREGCKSEVEILSRKIQELEREFERERANAKLAEKIASRL